MSGIVSGITKVFTSVGTAAARVGSAVAGVGATTFTAAAATGKSLLSGGLSSFGSGGGVLGNILTGAAKQAAVGALIGGGISALTGNGFGKGALMGGLGGALTGGITGAMQPTGMAGAAEGAASGTSTAATPTGFAPSGRTDPAPMTLKGGTMAMPASTRQGLMSGLAEQSAGMTGAAAAPAVAAAAPAAAAPASGGGLMGFLSSETGGSVISGLGQGYMAYSQSKDAEKQRKMQAEEYDKTRAADLAKEMRVRDSYDLGPDAYFTSSEPDTTARPTPDQKWGGSKFEYDPAQGRIVTVPA